MRMVSASLILIATLIPMQAQAANIDVSSTVDAVTVYPDGARVTRLITLDLSAGNTTAVLRDFPLTMDTSSLRVEGEAAAKLTIGSIDAKPPRAAPPVNLPEIDRQIEALKDQRADLQGKIAAAEARRKFAERFAEQAPAGIGEKGEARPLSEWRAAFAAVAEEVAAADADIRDAQRKQRELDRQIAQLQSDRAIKPPRKMEVRIDLATAAATKATLRVTYAVRNARWLPLYEARLDSGAANRKPALELVRRAEILQTTGEDWNNVTLAVSTVRTARGGSAPHLGSLIVKYPPVVRPLPASPRDAQVSRLSAPELRSMSARGSEQKVAVSADEQEAVPEIGSYQAVFRIPGRVSVGANDGAKSLRIATATIAPDLAIRAVPVLDPTAYLEASFKHNEDAPLLPGRVSIYRDGMFVGRSHLDAVAKDEMVRLGFGADDKVKIERTVVKRNEGTVGLINTSKTDERAFKTTIRNAHGFPIKIAIEDRLPVSENEDIKVEMLPSTTPPTTTDLRDRRGVLEWVFDAKAGEVRDIMLAWRVSWPKDKTIILTPTR